MLGAAEFGRYSAALAFAGLFAVATGPGAATFGTREMAKDARVVARLVPDIAALRVTLSLAVVPLLALVAWALGRPADAILALVLAGLGLPLYALVATLDSALVAHGRAGVAAACATLRQLAFIGFGVAALLLFGGAIALLVATNLALVARVGVTYFALRRALRVRLERPSPARWPALARHMLPFGVEGTADRVCLHAPLALLSLVASEHVVGLYGVAFNLVLVALPFAQSVGTALTPRLSAPDTRPLVPRAAGAALRITLALGVPTALAGTLAAPWIVTLPYGASFAAAAPALRVLMWALPVLFAFEALRAAILALRLEHVAARAAVASALTALAVSACSAPFLGAVGAELAFLLMRLCGVAHFALALARALPPGQARQALGLAHT